METKKAKKNIKQFKQALLSNTGFIKEAEPIANTKQPQPTVIDEVIMADVRDKYRILAAFEKIDEKELINKALNHYLKLKGLQLEQAIKEQK